MPATWRVIPFPLIFFSLLSLPSSDAFSCLSGGLVVSSATLRSRRGLSFIPPSRRDTLSSKLSSSSNNNNNSQDSEDESNKISTAIDEGVDQIFDAVDLDDSGSIDFKEYSSHLSSAGLSEDSIQRSFLEMDSDQNGEISRDEFRSAILMASTTNTAEEAVVEGDCPMGYWLNSVKQTCEPLGPIGRISQRLETLGPFKKTYQRISNLFDLDVSKHGVAFALSYSVISNINGSISLSVAWYMSCARTGLSPLAPGQWKSLLKAYGTIYAVIQVLRPFRIASAIAMSKLSSNLLNHTQEKLTCSRGFAIFIQYALGWVAWLFVATFGITMASWVSGVSVLGGVH